MKTFFVFFFVFFSFTKFANAQIVVDTNVRNSIIKDSLKPTIFYKNPYQLILDSNIFLNTKAIPHALPIQIKQRFTPQGLFYFIALLLLILGIVKFVYDRYFTTLLRVFFNTSLRQNQLTDQLEQAKLPSIIFNVFFVVTTGIYINLLLDYFLPDTNTTNWSFIFYCIMAVGLCYILKFISLKFIGWVTNNISEANSYIFTVFLINKMIGLLLLPIIIVLAFADKNYTQFVVFLSIIILAFLLLMRFVRAFSILQYKIKIAGYHFVLYVFALEILPLMLIYKTVTLFFGINT